MVKDRGQKQCFQGGAVQITKFQGPGILQSTLGWLEAGQNFQGIPSFSRGAHPRNTTLPNQVSQVGSPALQERKRSRRLCTTASLAQSLEVSSMSKGPRK